MESILGPSKPSSSDERLFHCPFCHHSKPKLSINFGKKHGMWKCWVCDESGRRISTLLYRLGYSKKEIKDILQDYTFQEVNVIEDKETVIRLPKEYIPLWKETTLDKSWDRKAALRYLKNRGVRMLDIYRYQIGWCPTGKYENRIIIPSHDKDNKLNFFTARAFYDAELPYLNPIASRNVILFENMINWNYPVVIVEGIFDAITVRRNVIPLFGKVMSEKLKQGMIENRPPMVYVMLDDDAMEQACGIEKYLKFSNLNVKLVRLSKKDPADMGYIESWNRIGQSKPAGFSDLVKAKL